MKLTRSLTRRMSRRAGVLLAISALLIPVAGAAADFEGSNHGEPGKLANGGALLINNRTVTPAGHQSALGDLPLSAVLAPDGKHLLVANSGAGVQSLQVVSTDDGSITQTIQYFVPDSVFVGLAYSPDGKHAYASGGGFDVLHTFNVNADATLTKAGDVTIGTLAANPFPTGLSISSDGKTIYVADNLANNVSVID
ncbi:MAG TPA: beta-propeller fold lactonase family protein, partial [Candidatus Dormibacteraeota bacterium]|nr:beta-propeller fold lactonase family protein [Candidatus Dormibacteraeota bacterium]